MVQCNNDSSGTMGVYQNCRRKKLYSFNPHHDQGMELIKEKTIPGACQIRNELQLTPFAYLRKDRISAEIINKYIIAKTKSRPG
ncbi:MAG: hypothetical protein GX176_05895 [Syntrophomonadaceae bacterium]|nr:hypothetical protein [Syntrophomonadaceae bacterium]HQD89482.1 hypothetical protein [Syntrophomonadaceae bacterium]